MSLYFTFLACVNKFIYRSGSEEEYEERDQLLTEHATLQDEKVRLKGEEAKRTEEKDNQGKEIRKAAMENIRARDDDEVEGNHLYEITIQRFFHVTRT